MVGIYSVTSPSNKVYIGQSINIERRFWQYRKLKINGQRKLLASLVKYGVDSHTFSVVHELPADCSNEVITQYEQFCIDQHLEAGTPMMNIRMTAGIRGPHSEETKLLIGAKHKGKVISQEQRDNHSKMLKGRPSHRKGTTHTDEAKVKIKAKRALQASTRGYKRKDTPWNKGMKGQYSLPGHPVTEEQKEKIRKALTGKKLSPESIAKRQATKKANGKKIKPWSDESRKRQSERVKLFNLNKKLNAL